MKTIYKGQGKHYNPYVESHITEDCHIFSEKGSVYLEGKYGTIKLCSKAKWDKTVKEYGLEYVIENMFSYGIDCMVVAEYKFNDIF